MRLSLHVVTAGLGLLAISCAARAANLSVAILDHQDQFSGTKGLGQLLDDLGQPYTDLTATVAGGSPIDLTGYNTFIIGSFCTEQANIRTALNNAATTMRDFVRSGGTIIMLTQADQTRAQETWIEPPAVVSRADPDFNLVYRVQPAHQIFNSPQVITDANLQGWTYKTWPTSWESLSVFQAVGVLAGDGPDVVGYATIVEAGWGTGRALFLSLALDKARNIGNAQAAAQAPRLMQNLLQYARNVQDGTVPPIIIYQGGGWSGPISGQVFEDRDGDGERDPGEPGIPGVGVSDTVDLVVTAADGTYTLPNTAGGASLLYICLPSGYAKSAQWYRAISASSTPADFQFALTPSDESGPFEFVQISDIHIGGSGTKDLLIEAIARICAMTNPPELILATGDLVNTGSTLTQYDDYVAGIRTSTIPLFNVFGNHDANNSGASNYRRYLGPDYYSFNYGDCHFLIVNSVQKTARQDAWIAADLALLRGTRKLFIFQHYSPTEAEYAQFTSCGTNAVFTGHWHSQHTVQVGPTASYNTGTLLFGGIDCSPAGFKIVSVMGDMVRTRMRWISDGPRLQIVTPTSSQVIANSDVTILVNAYETSSEVVGVTYQLKRGTEVVANGPLTRQGDWSWVGTVAQSRLGFGLYELTVRATNDRGEVSTAQSSFPIMGSARPRPTGGSWRQFGGGPARGGLAGSSSIRPPLGPAWIANVGGTFDFGSPVLDGQMLYVGVKDRRDFAANGVLALNVSDGSQRWFAPTPAAVSHSVAVDDQRVYAASHGGVLHALNRADGSTAWERTLGSAYMRWQYGSPLLYGTALYAGTYAYFGRFDAVTGTPAWSQSYGGDWISCNASPATDGVRVLVPANWATNSLRAVNPATGATLWQYTVQGLHGSPVIAGDKAVFTDYNGTLHCVRMSDGGAVWTKSLGGGRSASTPAVSGNTVVAGGTGFIRAFRLDTGAQLWEVALATSPLKMAPYNNTFAALAGSATIAGNLVYMPCGDGRLYVIDLTSGQVQWTMDFGTPILSAPCISDKYLYLTTYDGHVYALAGKDAFVMADFDGDGDVDVTDFATFQVCFNGPGNPPSPACRADADFDDDSDVDLSDFAVVQTCFNGPGAPPACQ